MIYFSIITTLFNDPLALLDTVALPMSSSPLETRTWRKNITQVKAQVDKRWILLPRYLHIELL